MKRHSLIGWLALVLVTLLVVGMPQGVRHLFLAEAAEPKQPQPRPQGRQFEREVADFLERYRQFLDCCATDLESLQQVKKLEDQAAALLVQAQTGVGTELKKLRSFTVREIVAPVEQARDDLRAIRERLERIQNAQKKLQARAQDLDFFTYWTENQKLRAALEAIPEEFRPRRRPARPPTGTEIGVTPPMGPEIGTVPPTGPEIGTVPPTGPEIGTTPPTGPAIGTVPPTGPAIGTTPPTGPAIGESSLNQPPKKAK